MAPEKCIFARVYDITKGDEGCAIYRDNGRKCDILPESQHVCSQYKNLDGSPNLAGIYARIVNMILEHAGVLDVGSVASLILRTSLTGMSSMGLAELRLADYASKKEEDLKLLKMLESGVSHLEQMAASSK